MSDRLIHDLIMKEPAYKVGGPTSESLVRSAEEKLGVRLPASLRSFALSYSYIFGPGGYVSIIAPGDDLSKQGGTAYLHTVMARETGSVPPTFVVLDGDDYPPICVDTSVVSDDGRCPVFCYYHLTPEKKRERIADDFTDYLQDWLAIRLEETA